MAEQLPPLAANAGADHLTRFIKRPDGQDVTAFRQQRDALVAMRSGVMEHEDRLGALEAALADVPFPFGARS